MLLFGPEQNFSLKLTLRLKEAKTFPVAGV